MNGKSGFKGFFKKEPLEESISKNEKYVPKSRDMQHKR